VAGEQKFNCLSSRRRHAKASFAGALHFAEKHAVALSVLRKEEQISFYIAIASAHFIVD